MQSRLLCIHLAFKLGGKFELYHGAIDLSLAVASATSWAAQPRME